MARRDLSETEEGQAAVEYVALVATVALALAALGTLVPRPADQMLSIVEQAICSGLGHGCEIGGEESLVMEPCPVRRSTTGTDLHATVLSVRAGRGESAIVEELSDGTATVTLGERGELGVEGGAGASISTGGGGGGARAEASVGLEFGAGRGYEFEGMDDALRFLAEQRASRGSHGPAELIAGPGCLLCGVAGIDPDEPPEPDFSYLEGGGAMHASAEAGAGPTLAGGEAAAYGVLGRRKDHRTGDVTSYYRMGGEAAADIGGPVAWTGRVGAESVLEYTTAADGTPLDLTIRSVREDTGRVGPAVRSPGAGATGRYGAFGDAEGGGDVVEQVASLDLGERPDREAATRLIEAIGPPSDPLAVPARLRDLDRRLQRAGQFEERVFSTTARESELYGDAALGLKLGGGVAHRATADSLTSARTRPAGATLFLDRADCLS
jgi:hypothetical protein